MVDKTSPGDGGATGTDLPEEVEGSTATPEVEGSAASPEEASETMDRSLPPEPPLEPLTLLLLLTVLLLTELLLLLDGRGAHGGRGRDRLPEGEEGRTSSLSDSRLLIACQK